MNELQYCPGAMTPQRTEDRLTVEGDCDPNVSYVPISGPCQGTDAFSHANRLVHPVDGAMGVTIVAGFRMDWYQPERIGSPYWTVFDPGSSIVRHGGSSPVGLGVCLTQDGFRRRSSQAVSIINNCRCPARYGARRVRQRPNSRRPLFERLMQAVRACGELQEVHIIGKSYFARLDRAFLAVALDVGAPQVVYLGW